jgi:uncharacterized protein YegP (UPF0339 family)
MATATKQAPAAMSTDHTPRSGPSGATLTFFTYRDNGGDYHWEIVDASGETLAYSGSFGSQVDAERAAREVGEGARSAELEPHAANAPHTVAVR